MKTPVQVEIAGQRYVLRSDEDERSVREMASYVDRQLKDVQKRTRTADTQALAVLAALQITEELFKERQALRALKKSVRDKGRALLQLIERQAHV